jgi:hypothetical protein
MLKSILYIGSPCVYFVEFVEKFFNKSNLHNDLIVRQLNYILAVLFREGWIGSFELAVSKNANYPYGLGNSK